MRAEGAYRAAMVGVFTNRRVLAAELGFATFTMVLHGSWVAIMLYAFDRGGVGAAGLLSIAVLVPAAAAGPFVAVFFDRYPPRTALAGGYLLQAAALGAVAVAISSDAPTLVVYALMALFVICQTASRPTMHSALPRVVDTPTELAAANSLTEIIETAGLVLGPLVAGLVLLGTDGLAAPFTVSGVAMVIGALAAAAIGAPHDSDIRDTVATAPTSVLADVRNGAALLADEPAPRNLVSVIAAVYVTVGAVDVAVVPLAIDRLERTDATVGFLATALGMGAVAGAAASFVLIGWRRLTIPIVGGFLLATLPIALAAPIDSLGPTFLLLLAVGFGRPILAVGSRTLLQRLSATDTLARLFGFVEAMSLLSIAIGSGLFALVAVTFGLSSGLIVAGIVPIAALVVLAPGVLRIDRDRQPADPAVLALLRGIPIFATLAPFRLEQLLVNLRPARFEPNATIFELGDEGDAFHVIAEGEAIVELPSGDVSLGRGDFFGEIALLSDQPRMATVRAGADGLAVQRLDRHVFLDAVVPGTTGRAIADRIVFDRLGD